MSSIYSRSAIKLFSLATLVALATSLTGTIPPNTAHAAPITDFVAGRIIDDGVFTDYGSMSPSNIQFFLNVKGSSCVNGEAPCLKNFSEGGRSAAQIIYDAAQEFRINPQVIIVTLQKEVGLATVSQPGNWRYRTAMGYGCPDSTPGVCDSQYYGFTNQVRWASRMFRKIMDGVPQSEWYTPYVLGNNFIRWSPNSNCGGNTVYIQNRATQALYNFTPYQPNQAALNAGYGSGDGCSAYGNRNFFLYFRDWFGSTTVHDPYGWRLIKTAEDSRVYLTVGNTKRWIPTGEIFNDWNFAYKPVETVSQGELDGIPTIPPLDRLGYFNNRYFYVDGGKKYWLSNDALIRAWGQSNKLGIAAPAFVALASIPDGGEAPFYISLPSESKVARLINGQKYLINASDADRWQANPVALTASSFNSMSTAATVDYRISVNGVKYVVDSGRLLNVNSYNQLRDYGQQSATFVTMPDEIFPYLPPQSAGPLVTIAGNGTWWMLRAGEKFYVPTASHGHAWGVGATPTVISARLGASFAQSSVAGGILPLIIQDSGNSKVYMLDGAKHELSGAMLDAAKPSGSSFPALSSEYLNDIRTAHSISSPIIRSYEIGAIYTFDDGKLYHIPNGNVLNGLGYPRKYGVSDLSRLFADGYSGNIRGMSMFIKIGSTTYFLQDGNLFPITSTALADWTNGSIVPTFASANLNTRFDIQGSYSLGNFIQEGNDKYAISNGTAHFVGGFDPAYLANGNTWKLVSLFGMPRTGVSSTIVKSTDGNDGRIFVLSKGTKQHILSGESFSALTRQGAIKTTSLSPTLLNQYPQINGGTNTPPLVYTDGKGFKLLTAAGTFYEFPNGDTLVNFASGGNPSIDADPGTYDKYSQSAGAITRLIKDPSGKIYWIENGRKRWITSGSAFQAYSGTPVTNVNWIIPDWLPNGPVIQ